MKTIKLFLFLLFSVVIASPIFSQGFQPPAEGNAVVYFARISGWGSGTKFDFFHNDKYIGTFKGKNYMRYECPAGHNLFWASSENKEFLPSDLKAGGTYIVIVDIVTGFWKNHVGLAPVTNSDTEGLDRAIELIKSKKPVEFSQSKIDKGNKKLKKFISEELNHYENVTKNKYNFNHISPDMAISEEKLK